MGWATQPGLAQGSEDYSTPDTQTETPTQPTDCHSSGEQVPGKQQRPVDAAFPNRTARKTPTGAGLLPAGPPHLGEGDQSDPSGAARGGAGAEPGPLSPRLSLLLLART